MSLFKLGRFSLSPSIESWDGTPEEVAADCPLRLSRFSLSLSTESWDGMPEAAADDPCFIRGSDWTTNSMYSILHTLFRDSRGEDY